ncbi:hypothetical protein [Acinetobacter lanii]|uniref:Uncharacterized protein n=1 Tax=Acinetobacter lanii TaxID=2715163 RepID=A0A6G8S477_9GAMM|nr:hypothetical protein [Acinetobacter lanii]QIO08934.1 hypothetical protein G8D99_07855 [Acinetobacter lanii]
MKNKDALVQTIINLGVLDKYFYDFSIKMGAENIDEEKISKDFFELFLKLKAGQIISNAIYELKYNTCLDNDDVIQIENKVINI